MAHLLRASAWGCAVLAGAGALTLLTARALPQGPTGPILLQSSAYETRAARDLVGKPDDAGLMRARAQTLAGLGLNPDNPVAWMRLAWIEDRLAGGGFPARSQAAVSRSYDVAPYGPQISEYRLTFVLDRWPTASAGLKEQARSELAVLWVDRRATLNRAVAASRSRQGRLAARVAMARIAATNGGG